jgi:hypothetical protein
MLHECVTAVTVLIQEIVASFKAVKPCSMRFAFYQKSKRARCVEGGWSGPVEKSLAAAREIRAV